MNTKEMVLCGSFHLASTKDNALRSYFDNGNTESFIPIRYFFMSKIWLFTIVASDMILGTTSHV